MLNFETRTGPDFGAAAPSYPTQGVPEWYRDAKLGFFVHWGLYSVPAWAVQHGEGVNIPAEDAYAWHQYAEWYGNTVRIAGSPTWERHQQVYGPGTSYEDLADLWDASAFDADAFVGELVGAGAKYVIPTTKHHEGFCLWNTATTGFNSVARGPKRDLISEFHDATRRAGARFGVYYSGALDWHVSDFPAIESDTDLFRFRRHDEHFSRYSAAQLEELVEKFSPDVLWNDIEWPDGGKGSDDYAVAALLSRYFDAVPEGVVNDRWGVPYHGFLTREYRHIPDILEHPWESTRGLGYSFGFNQAEDDRHSLSGAELIRMLVDVVSKNGNLLINVGPAADGSIPALQLEAMRAMGAWLTENGSAIYGTRPWVRFGEPLRPVRYTTSSEGVHVHALEPESGELTVPAELAEREARWADGSIAESVPASDGTSTLVIPDALRGDAVAVAMLR
ncbi:alpha-L-fucosidase [Microbacterium esteraromaticum]|uniref:alpha-L-fucosidase n=1 Tax=Microbacterium esteraromaticum TaxID=57043 RepID=UPI002367F618|nr:alpha-L-fucosidase [Microbacterium esteraromaticum]WDH80048.1 alpha-L-fucosidase [Microbacterium esteraromaticum]